MTALGLGLGVQGGMIGGAPGARAGALLAGDKGSADLLGSAWLVGTGVVLGVLYTPATGAAAMAAERAVEELTDPIGTKIGKAFSRLGWP